MLYVYCLVRKSTVIMEVPKCEVAKDLLSLDSGLTGAGYSIQAFIGDDAYAVSLSPTGELIHSEQPIDACVA